MKGHVHMLSRKHTQILSGPVPFSRGLMKRTPQLLFDQTAACAQSPAVYPARLSIDTWFSTGLDRSGRELHSRGYPHRFWHVIFRADRWTLVNLAPFSRWTRQERMYRRRRGWPRRRLRQGMRGNILHIRQGYVVSFRST
ncbi:hypothetical protein BGW80DRAFT_1432250 [Lactifluus volemus]|nr:hypothetical protein BGW80DRAFT_1432250 [Lactifluus volemus]